MKKVCYCFFISFLFCVLFSSCQMEPVMAKVTLEFNSTKGTASVDKDSVPLGSFVTVTVDPKIGYDFKNFKGPSSNLKYYPTDNEYEYKVLVNRVKFNLEVSFYTTYSESISTKLKNCSIAGGIKSSAYKNEIIKFKLIPSECYCVTEKNIEILSQHYSNVKIPVTKAESEENTFYFKMPGDDVVISVDASPLIEIVPDKEKFIKNDTITFIVNNYSSAQKCNLYYSYSSENYKEEYKTDYDISTGEFTFTPSECGQIKIIAEVGDGTLLDLGTVIVEPEDFPQDKKIVSCHLWETVKSGNSSSLSVKYEFLSYNPRPSYSFYYDMYFYNKDKNIIRNTFDYLDSEGKLDSPGFEYEYDEPKEIFVQISREEYMSDYIPLVIPCYEKVSATKSQKYNSLTLALDDVLIPGEGFDDLFIAERASDGKIQITSKIDAKPTKNPRILTVKDSGGTEKVVLAVTLSYDGWPSIQRK